MGVGAMGLQFALLARRRGVSFTRTLMIGRQLHYVDTWWVKTLFERFGFPISEAEAERSVVNPYAEGVYRALGAEVTDSLDASDYEHANVIHDLNTPIPRRLRQRYTCVVDHGSLEHVFNFPVALKNAIDMIEIGGHFIAVTPANNFMGHGFYQLSPELYFNFLGRNGFTDIQVYIVPYRWLPRLFRVTDPRAIGGRVELCNSEPVQLGVIARKAEHLHDMVIPMQSDYQNSFWQGRDVDRSSASQADMDPKLAAAIGELRTRIASLAEWPETISPHFTAGLENSLHYQPVDPAID